MVSWVSLPDSMFLTQRLLSLLKATIDPSGDSISLRLGRRADAASAAMHSVPSERQVQVFRPMGKVIERPSSVYSKLVKGSESAL